MQRNHSKVDILSIIILFAIVSISLCFEFNGPINRDVASFIYNAREYLFHGRIPYKDILEINLPLSTWIFMPMVWLSHKLGLSSEMMIVACRIELYLLIGVSLFLSWKIVGNRDFSLGKGQRQLFFIIFLWIVTLGCGADFGERDQLILAFILPELLLSCLAIKLKRQSSELSRSFRAIVGIFAFMAIAMKPHYVLALLLPELFLLMRYRKLSLVFRPETWAILFLGVIYSLIIVLAYPAIFAVFDIVKFDVYHQLSRMSFKEELDNIGLLGLIIILRLIFQLFGRPQKFDALLVAVIGAYLAYVSQLIGFPYQRMPFEGLAVAWIFLALPPLRFSAASPPKMSQRGKYILDKLQIRYSLLSLMLLTIASLISIIFMRSDIEQTSTVIYSLRGDEDEIIYGNIRDANTHTRILIHQYAHHEPVLFLGTTIQAFPAIVYEDVELANRWAFLWTLPRELALPENQRGALSKTLAEDIAKYKPSLILVDRRDIQSYVPYKFDYIAYFTQWPEFREQWKNYQPIPRDPEIDVGSFELFRRVN